ncbi:MAG: hypothetical protein NTW87_09115 [Planctomycetota bacterium]|nr:hypothetical protein [Planctomycetota bacterium]
MATRRAHSFAFPAWHGPARGFSLLELAVASFIAMIIFTVGFIVITGTLRTRSESTARIRATENGRLFFQMLERDLAGAWPGPFNMFKGAADTNPSVPPAPMVVRDTYVYRTPEKVPRDVPTDILQFYTRSDTRAPDGTNPDRRVFVRYYVNTLEHTLCRQVVEDEGLDPANGNTTPTALETNQNNAAPLETRLLRDERAVFEGVHQLLIYHRQWQPDNKTFLPALTDNKDAAAADYKDCTHLLVKLVLYDQYAADRQKNEVTASERKSPAADWDILTFRAFVKVLPIPTRFMGGP